MRSGHSCGLTATSTSTTGVVSYPGPSMHSTHSANSLLVHTRLSTSPVSLVKGTLGRPCCELLVPRQREGLGHPSPASSMETPEPGRCTKFCLSQLPSGSKGLPLNQGHPSPSACQKLWGGGVLLQRPHHYTHQTHQLHPIDQHYLIVLIVSTCLSEHACKQSHFLSLVSGLIDHYRSTYLTPNQRLPGLSLCLL